MFPFEVLALAAEWRVGVGGRSGSPGTREGWHSLAGTRCLRLQWGGGGVVTELKRRKGFGICWGGGGSRIYRGSGMSVGEMGE